MFFRFGRVFEALVGVRGGAKMSRFGKKWPFSLDFGLVLAYKK
jgi:hypothetical protein